MAVWLGCGWLGWLVGCVGWLGCEGWPLGVCGCWVRYWVLPTNYSLHVGICTRYYGMVQSPPRPQQEIRSYTRRMYAEQRKGREGKDNVGTHWDGYPE